LDDVCYYVDPIFGFEVPKSCPGLPDQVLYPAFSWANQEDYMNKYKSLAARFIDNFKVFAPDCSSEVIAAGPKI
jgi:phosphoenolpyruvate carboxykinase (ATP)